MKLLAVDIGTGTQDILLFDSRLDVENSFKLVLPAPTMIVHRRLRRATARGEAVLLTGVTMGGGPSGWAAEAHARAGLPIFATPDAARTFNDDLDAVRAGGIQIVSEDEAVPLRARCTHIELRDFDFAAIQKAFDLFGISLDDLDALAVAVFDHGAAPADVSDRQFRFDYLNERIHTANRLSSFAFAAGDIPPIMTRLQAVARCAANLPAPLMVMDTAPAAILGALFDPLVAARPRQLIANVGNFHTLAFRLGPDGIEGVFEHHTGLLDRARLEDLLRRLADGSLRHTDVFDNHGHGALILNPAPLPLDAPDFNVVVTGPRRALLARSSLGIYNAVPFGDMMIAGCFGLLAAAADVFPQFAQEIHGALHRQSDSATPPWEAVE